MSAPPHSPPPGWYTDPTGYLRWWDGSTWGPYAPAPPPRTEEDAGKVLALVSWLGFFVAYGLVALVVRIVERDGNRFARWHAAEALNVQLTAFVVAVPVWLFAVLGLFSSTGNGPPWSFLAAWAVMMAMGFGTVALAILGAVRAGQGVWWRCPVAIPFLRRHRRER